MPRLLHPFADRPAFTLLEFAVRTEPETIYKDRPARIVVAIGGPSELPDQANVVFIDAADRRGQSLPMLHGGEGRFTLDIERAESSRRFVIDTPDGRSGEYRLDVHPVPTFDQVRAVYAFPPYTGWPPAPSMLTVEKDLRAMAGTGVTVTVTSNMPLGDCRMLLTSTGDDAAATTVTLRPTDEPNVVTGAFTLDFDGQYAITLTSREGVAGNDTFTGRIHCLPDTPPTVEFTEPGQTVVAPENWKVPVAIAARDDVAVARIVLYRSINGIGPYPVTLDLQSAGPTYATAASEFDLPTLGARPGDVITYFASAYDNHPGGEQFADTATFLIRVISEQEYLKYARTKYRMEQVEAELEAYRAQLELIAALREELIKQLEALAKAFKEAGKLSDAQRRQLERIVGKQQELAAAARDLAAQLRERLSKPPLYEFEFEYRDALAKTAEDMEAMDRRTMAVTESYPSMAQSGQRGKYVDNSLEELRRGQKKMQQAQERTALSARQMKQLAKADRLIALTESIVALADQQRELADRLGQFRNSERLSPAQQIRARRMAAEQGQLRRELAATLKQFDIAAADAEELLPKMAASVKKLAEDIRQLQVLRDQDNAATLAQAGQGRYAHRAADEAATKLASLIAECSPGNMMGKACDEIDKALKLTRQRIQQSLQQLSQGRGVPGFGQGGSGAGYYGSRAQMMLMGPHVGSSKAGARASRGGPSARRPTDPAGLPAAESLTPEADRAPDAAAAGLQGVPVQFRSLAEQYLLRLADESK